MVELTDKNFESEVLKAKTPVLVDFWAPWCGPCKRMEPILHELEKAYAAKVKFCKLNVDDNSDSPTKYSVGSIPTMLFFKSGELLGSTVGITPKEGLMEKLDNLLE